MLLNAEDVVEAAESLEIAQRSGDNAAVTYSLISQAIALIHNKEGTHNDFEARRVGFELLSKARQMIVDEHLTAGVRRMADVAIARERARSGDLGDAIDLATTVLAEQFDAGEMIFRGPATTVLVEALLSRGSTADVKDAQRAVDTLAAVPTEPGFVLHELPALRLRALLARAHGDEPGYHQFVERFRAKAQEADFEGYLAQAEAMAGA